MEDAIVVSGLRTKGGASVRTNKQNWIELCSRLLSWHFASHVLREKSGTSRVAHLSSRTESQGVKEMATYLKVGQLNICFFLACFLKFENGRRRVLSSLATVPRHIKKEG